MFKKIIILLLMLVLTNCAPTGTAFLGPSITAARTGSVYQAGLSYGSSHIMKKTKESLDKIRETRTFVYQRVNRLSKKIEKDKLNKVDLKNKADIFFKAVKDNLKKYN